MQLQADEGPCVECFSSAAPVSAADLTQEQRRWPRFTAAVAARRGYRSVHAVPLQLRAQAIGALNLFHREAGPQISMDAAFARLRGYARAHNERIVDVAGKIATNRMPANDVLAV
ncbi:MAG TPA: hypothetical protein VFA63_19675 [Pseudonocardiaceae bacterium]|jgi:hypothetical protein|nr:hypothetical protein [Pseudonocardiaceae bacterium]